MRQKDSRQVVKAQHTRFLLDASIAVTLLLMNDSAALPPGLPGAPCRPPPAVRPSHSQGTAGLKNKGSAAYWPPHIKTRGRNPSLEVVHRVHPGRRRRARRNKPELNTHTHTNTHTRRHSFRLLPSLRLDCMRARRLCHKTLVFFPPKRVAFFPRSFVDL